jgi:tRNA pseudouridine55 synthase
MSIKQTYRHKNAERLSLDLSPKEVITISGETKHQYEEGKVILIDKPLHWTSFDMVRKIRGMLRIKKVGHAGTLDPLATGLLIICTGKFTKQINAYMAAEKEYTGSITFGAVTATYDLESIPEQEKDFSYITKELLYEKIKQFIGEIEQVPPIYSAIKKNGISLYELARRGEEVAIKARKIRVNSFEITSFDLPVVNFRISCGTGTYIRSLANDLGAAIGSGAYLSGLRRTRIGEANVADAEKIEEFTEKLKSGHVS